MQKTVLSAQGLLEDSFRLAANVLKDDYRPSLIIAIWRGGTPVGMALQELMAYCGVNADHIAIRTSSYHGVDKRSNTVAVHGLDYIIDTINIEDRLLIVDDVFDTGNTIAAVIAEIRRRARDNMAEDVRIAVPWYKPARNQTTLTPDYFVHETDEWLVFPHELDALDGDELRIARPALAEVIEQAHSAKAS
ncbi:MAG: phosphoribosyltransferase family protein [Pseudomonadota bacterium]